ncbi:hypothetical protein [Kribbella sp. NPDC048928]|uniref:hypothetical protein n=1 Tax=Kribbella sp. NPDC048928 TaxID=3364111 RepID=UPI003720AC2F
MKLYLVRDLEGGAVWVAALAHETMYAYVANTGKFHDNNALRNDFYMDRRFTYEPIGAAEARRWIAEDLGMLNDTDHPNALAKWRADPSPLTPADVFSMAAGSNE